MRGSANVWQFAWIIAFLNAVCTNTSSRHGGAEDCSALWVPLSRRIVKPVRIIRHYLHHAD
jgi:hypothetical protein